MNFIELQVDGEDTRINLDHVVCFSGREDGCTVLELTNGKLITVDNNYAEVEEEQLIQEAWSMKLNMDEESK